jgi:hypothetical protein
MEVIILPTPDTESLPYDRQHPYGWSGEREVEPQGPIGIAMSNSQEPLAENDLQLETTQENGTD